jgi:phosphohistidine phosphatase
MPTLLLLRHAKSSWADDGARDFDRALAPRGERAAPLMGAFMAQHELTPDLVLCSPAVRARETLDLVLGELTKKPVVQYADELYLASPREMVALLHALPIAAETGAPERVMVVGHNPGFQTLARLLCQGGDEDGLAALAGKFPTAALAVIDFEGAWGKIATGSGLLRLFATPRALASAAAT